MTTKLRCTCGAEVTPATQNTGDVVRCLRCGAGLRVPPSVPPLKLQKNQFSEEELNAPFAPIRDDDSSSSTSRLPLLTGVAGFAGGVALTLLVVWLIGPARATQIADRPLHTNPGPVSAAASTPPAVAGESAPAASIPPAAAAVIPGPAPAKTLSPPVEKEPVVTANVPLKTPPAEQMQEPKKHPKPAAPPVAPLPADGVPRTVLQFPPRGEFQHSFKIVQSDAAPEYANYMLQTSGDEFDPNLNVFFLANKVLKKSQETVHFAFATSAESWEYLEFHEIKFIVDGEVLDVGESQHAGKALQSGGVVELITVPVELEAFLQILQATNVEVSLGGTEFQLTEEQLEAMRELATHIPDGETTPGNYLIGHSEE